MTHLNLSLLTLTQQFITFRVRVEVVFRVSVIAGVSITIQAPEAEVRRAAQPLPCLFGLEQS